MNSQGTNTTDTKLHWWSVKESGTLFGLKFLRFIHNVFGRWLVSLMLLPTVLYFLLFRPLARQSSQEFLLTHYENYPSYWKSKPTIWSTARHMLTFAESVVDKLLSWAIELDSDNFKIANLEHVESLRADTRGQLIIGSHMGNLEYCRGFVHRYRGKVVNILVHDKNSENYNTIMQELNPTSRLNVFQVEEFDIPTMLKLKTKIDAGEWIFIAGDRAPLSGAERSAPVDFFSKTAYFPVGPYLLAKGLACPVTLMFSYCDYHSEVDKGKVHFDVVPFSERIEINRKSRETQLQEYAQQFASELEKQCAKAPYQWFNFYEFWKQPA